YARPERNCVHCFFCPDAAANTPSTIGILVARFSHGPRLNNALGVLGAGQPIGHIIGLVLGIAFNFVRVPRKKKTQCFKGGLLTQTGMGYSGVSGSRQRDLFKCQTL
ncbi:hypothetical protein C8J57DRAFT_1377276, partial [Mycena rebaudengoi]